MYQLLADDFIEAFGNDAAVEGLDFKIQFKCVRSILTAVETLAPLLEAPSTPAEFWQAAFAETYEREMRPESPQKIRALYETDPARYDRALRSALAEFEARGELSVSWREGRFEVTAPPPGREALQRFKAAPGRFSLVILDLTMPHMGGIEAFRSMKLLASEARIIMSSGYSEQDAAESLLSEGLAGFLQKPYQMSDLQKLLPVVLAE